LPEFKLGSLTLDGWLYLGGMLLGVKILLRRSDKPLLPNAFKKRFEKTNEEILP
jgi:hypothetical protein